MAYNLRPRTLAQALRDAEDFENEEAFDGSDSESEDNLSIESEKSDYENESDAESGSDVEMAEAENAAGDQRLLSSRARGRPAEKLRGKDGFEWSTKLANRRSGMKFSCSVDTLSSRPKKIKKKF